MVGGSFFSRGLATAATALLLLGSCAPSPTEPPAAVADDRMARLLGEIRDRAARDNPFLGAAQLEEIEAELAGLPADEVPDLRRWLFNRLAGQHKLRLGRIEEAVTHYERSQREWERFIDEIPPKETLETHFDLGVAYLRLGETDNCAARHAPESCILPLGDGAIHTLTRGSEGAMRWFTRTLELAPPGSYHAVKARWLLNIAAMTLGKHPHGVPERYRITAEQLGAGEAFPRFVNVAGRLGLDAFDLAGGAAIEDYDGDGLLDIVTSTSDTAGRMRYYRRLADGGFVEEGEARGLGDQLGGLNLIHGDYDDDGDVDLYVLRGAWWRAEGRHPNSLLRNDGDGRFTDVTFAAGLGEVHYPTQTAAWADYDNDGDLDLYVGNEHSPDQPSPSQLFRNDGGSFTDVASAAGVENRRYAKAVVWGDYDGDGDADLFVANMPEANRLYRNDGDGTFTDVARQAGVERPAAAFPSWFWDHDNDGDLDLFVSAYGGAQAPPDVAWVAASALGMAPPAELAALYRNDGEQFTDVALAAGLDEITLPMGSNFGDLDGDGLLDFYLGTGYPYYEGVMPNKMYLGTASGFRDVTWNGGFGHLQKGHGVVFADLDHDGDLDLFEQMGGAYPGDAFGNALYENPGFERHWIQLRLVGTTSNRFGVGARIRIDLGARSVHRTVGTGGSFGANPLRLHVGLGEAERIETLEVHWPTSGTTQRFDDVAVDRLYRLREGSRELEPLPYERAALPR